MLLVKKITSISTIFLIMMLASIDEDKEEEEIVLLNAERNVLLEEKTPPEKLIVKKKKKDKEKVKAKKVEKAKKDYREITVEATAYVSFCDTGCTGITATGTNVQNTIYHPSGMKIIATDPNVIPLGSVVEINGEKYIADDTGGAIKGNRIDILMGVRDTTEAYKFGRKNITIKVFD